MAETKDDASQEFKVGAEIVCIVQYAVVKDVRDGLIQTEGDGLWAPPGYYMHRAEFDQRIRVDPSAEFRRGVEAAANYVSGDFTLDACSMHCTGGCATCCPPAVLDAIERGIRSIAMGQPPAC